MSEIQRGVLVYPVTISSGAATSGVVDISKSAGGAFYVPSGYTGGTTCTFTACSELGGTYVAVYDESNAAVSITIAASRAYPIPVEVMVHRYFKFVVNSNTSRDESIIVSLKS